MINGTLVVNHYMRNDKFDDLYNMFKTSAYDNNINLSVITNREINIDTGYFSSTNYSFTNTQCCRKTCIKDIMHNDNTDFILFWDKDIILARHLEHQGYLVFNSSEAIRICDDKALTHVELASHGIPMPRTIVSPFTYDSVYNNTDFVDEIVANLGFPMVVKARQGSFGAQVHKADTKEQLIKLIESYPAGSLIFQEYIKTSHGKDIRLQVVGDKVVCSMYRFSNYDFRANITNGGQMKIYNPSSEECELAIKTSKCLGLDFAGVDLLFGEDDKMLVCEVNSNAHFRNIYNLTKVNVADEILKYIKSVI